MDSDRGGPDLRDGGPGPAGVKHLVFGPEPDLRLDLQLANRLGPVLGREVAASEITQLLAQGSVYRSKVRLRDPGAPGSGAEIEVFWPDLPVTEFTLDPTRVVWQDEHLLVVDKPARVNTAPSPFSDIDCLTWGVQKYLGGEFPIHAVHRLDRDTQGLVFFAKTKEAELGLHKMFRERTVRKVYRALTPPFVLTSEEAPKRVYRWRDTLEYRGKGQPAATTVLAQGVDSEGRGVWTVLPHTGRPHQIRRHFARYLVPLWGDRAYAPGVYGPEVDLGLACIAYRCRHPVTGQTLSVFRNP